MGSYAGWGPCAGISINKKKFNWTPDRVPLLEDWGPMEMVLVTMQGHTVVVIVQASRVKKLPPTGKFS